MDDHNKDQAPANANDTFNTTESTPATEPAVPPTDPNDPDASIEIIVSDGNNQMAFKIRMSTKMGKMMARYAEMQGRNRAVMRFLFDGEKVVDGDTPASVSKVCFLTSLAMANSAVAGDGRW